MQFVTSTCFCGSAPSTNDQKECFNNSTCLSFTTSGLQSHRFDELQTCLWLMVCCDGEKSIYILPTLKSHSADCNYAPDIDMGLLCIFFLLSQKHYSSHSPQLANACQLLQEHLLCVYKWPYRPVVVSVIDLPPSNGLCCN